MSIDKSLISRNKLKRPRSVLTRAERLEQLEEEGKWNEGESVFGLPKVKVQVVRRKAKVAKEGAPEEQQNTAAETS